MSTPWGTIQDIEPLERGISFVYTASHGGLRISKGYAEKYLFPETIAKAQKIGNYLYYEEDCDWAVPAYELTHLYGKFFQWSKDSELKNSKKLQLLELERLVKFWNAEYAITMGYMEEGDKFCCKQWNDCPNNGEPALAIKKDNHWVCSKCGIIIG